MIETYCVSYTIECAKHIAIHTTIHFRDSETDLTVKRRTDVGDVNKNTERYRNKDTVHTE